MEYLLDNTMDAGLVFDPDTTAEESQDWARDQLLQGGIVHKKVFATLFVYKLLIEWNHDNLLEKNHALNWAKYILDRDTISILDDGRKTFRFIWNWLNYLASYSNGVFFGVWRWTCKGNTKIRPIAGVWVTFTIPNNDGRCGNRDAAKRLNTTLKTRMTRFY